MSSLGTVPSEFKCPAVIAVIVIAVIDGIAKCTVYDSETGYLKALSDGQGKVVPVRETVLLVGRYGIVDLRLDAIV